MTLKQKIPPFNIVILKERLLIISLFIQTFVVVILFLIVLSVLVFLFL